MTRAPAAAADARCSSWSWIMDSLSPVHRVWSIAARTSFAIFASLGSHVRCPLATPLLERCRGTVNADSSGTGKRSGKGAAESSAAPMPAEVVPEPWDGSPSSPGPARPPRSRPRSTWDPYLMTNEAPGVGADPDQSLLEDGDGLLDWPALQAWIATSSVPGTGPVVACRQLAGGTQNNLFELTREDGSTTVLRRPPRHPRPKSDETMLREARVLTAIEGHGVPQPTCHAVCDDPGVIGTCFYVMSAVGGFAPVGDLPGRYATDPDWRHRLGLAMVDAIASLARIRPDEVGLGDLGRPEGWLERQVGRWRKQLESYAAFDGYDG
ncbi:MAG TPA: phosphotransferase family protein, partial [Acidimicrobiia bacterium]|nr:phosphotransferase family protein [Acidimicrobiia bacterium]